MVRRNRKNEELVSDPHELLLSLVDMGSLDSDEALLACVTEMSDAECKRVLNSLSLPACCDDAECDDAECDDEDDLEVIDEPMTDDEDDDLDPVVDEIVDLDDEDDADDEDNSDDTDEEEVEACNHRDLEARLNRLERALRKESMRRRRR